LCRGGAGIWDSWQAEFATLEDLPGTWKVKFRQDRREKGSTRIAA